MSVPIDPVAAACLRVAAPLGPVLAVDTSSAEASLCLCVPATHRVAERSLAAVSLPSESLVTHLATLMRDEGLRVQDLRALVISLGPGSFTGLRVGLATIKGLALGSDIPVYGVSSLAVLAASTGPGWVSPVLDARRGDIYAALYDVAADGSARPHIDDTVVPAADWLPRLEAAMVRPGPAPRLVGDYASRLLPMTKDVSDTSAPRHTGATSVSPRAACAIVVAEAALRAGPPGPLAALVPRYLRLSEAERQLTR